MLDTCRLLVHPHLQVTPNAGFLAINALSFLQPHALAFATPPELLPYGWTTTDLWCAPLITALYALLTHAQPFWADAHAVLLGWLGTAVASGTSLNGEDGVYGVKPAPVDAETARALCAAVLAALFSVRTMKKFGGAYMNGGAGKFTDGGLRPPVDANVDVEVEIEEKVEVTVNGNGNGKIKVQ